MYEGDEIRIDGYYYGRAEADYRGVLLYELLVLDSNGVVKRPGTVEYDEMDQYMTKILEPDAIDNRYDKGLFLINNGEIQIEHWVASQCGYPVMLRTGSILNDTTFVIKHLKRKKKKRNDEWEVNHEFYFRQFDLLSSP